MVRRGIAVFLRENSVIAYGVIVGDYFLRYETYLKFTEGKPELIQMAEKIKGVAAGLDGEKTITQS